ncbi:MAG: hypothetical protein JW841_02605 [Deltaproteobacteria bacterium]|nr:hypothetical protein [Deltaproteobacteria bacterium]
MTKASAPGKLVLIGEYAVLTGAQALVMAVEKRAKVSILKWPTSVDSKKNVVNCYINALAFSLQTQACQIINSRFKYISPVNDELRNKLIFIEQAIVSASKYIASQGGVLCDFSITTDTSDLYSDDGCKLGFGSSAALVSATFIGLLKFAGITEVNCNKVLPQIVDVHRQAQGSGSGIDVAAAVMGSVIQFTLGKDKQISVKNVNLPKELQFGAVSTRQEVNTASILAALKHYRKRDSMTYGKLMSQLSQISHESINAIEQQDTIRFLHAISDYNELMIKLSDTSGIELVSQTHRLLADIVVSNGGYYKPSGAGGDLGLFACRNQSTMKKVSDAVLQEGFEIVPLIVAGDGAIAS